MGSACSRHPDVIEFNKSNETNERLKNEKLEKINNNLNEKENENNYDIKVKNEIKATNLNELSEEESKNYIKGDIIGEGKVGITYSSLCFNTGKIVSLKLIDLKKFTQSPEILKNKLIEDFKLFKQMNYKHENLNDYITYQDYKENPNCK